jgi:hypothetical protein
MTDIARVPAGRTSLIIVIRPVKRPETTNFAP